MANRKKTPSSNALTQWLLEHPGAHLLDNPRTTTTGGTREGDYPDINTPSPDPSSHPTSDLNSLANSANYGALISLLAQALGTDESALLGMLGLTMNDMDGWQQADWNKQLLDQLTSLSLEYDKRGYNEKMLSDQRLYDNPQNQLARLMGAGISRDAAIQMLSGGSGSGGSGVVTGDAAALASGIPATQSTLNGIQAGTSIANAVFGGISAVTGLVSLGISIPQAVANVTAMGIQNTLSQKALLGLQSADAVMSAFSNALEVGALTTEQMDGFSNGTDALNYAFKNKDSDAFKGIFADGSFAQVYGTKLGRDMFAQLWKSVRSSKDDGTILDNYIKNQRLQNALAELQADQIGAELQKLGAETQAINQSVIESISRVAEINAQIQVLNKQGKWIDVQTKYQPQVWSAEIEKLGAETESLNIQNAINQDVFEINHAGVPMLKQQFIDECEFAAWHASCLNSEESRQQYWAAWMNDAHNAHAAAYLKYLYNSAVGDFATDNPQTWRLLQGFRFSGGFDAVKVGADAAGKAAAASRASDLFKYLPK